MSRKAAIGFLVLAFLVLSSHGQENSAAYWLKRGIASYNNRSFDEAISFLENSISMDPSCAEAWFWKGDCYQEQDDKDHPDYQKNKDAIECFDNALKLSSSYVDAYIDKSFSEAQIGMYDEALESINKALELDPNNSNAMNVKGVIYHFLREYDEAFNWYNKAKEADPLNSNPWYNEGQTYQSLGESTKANFAFKKAEELDKKAEQISIPD